MKTNELHIIGAGSLGSFTSFLLSKVANVLDCQINVYDFDKVERHNIENQLYRIGDVNRLKIDALKEIISNSNGFNINVKNTEINTVANLSGIPIVLVDSMKSRKDIFLSSIYDAAIPYYLEARTGTQEALVYAFNPRSKDWVDRYTRTLCSDNQIRGRPCANQDMVPVLWTVASAITRIILKLKSDKVSRNEFLEIGINFQDWPILKPGIIEEL